MLIAITEINSWEREKWTYVLDVDKQDNEVLNDLMIFVRIANERWEKAKAEAERLGPPVPYHAIFNPHPIYVFAASKYWVKFYKSLDTTGKYPKLLGTKSGGGRIMNGSNGYKGNSFDLRLVISPRRMKSVMQKMRDKGENMIYKNFEYLFLKTTHKELTQ